MTMSSRLSSYYEVHEPSQEDRKPNPLHPLRIRLEGVAPSIPSMTFEDGYPTSPLGTLLNGISFSSTVQPGGSIPPISALRIRRKGTTAPPLPLDVTRGSGAHNVPASAPARPPRRGPFLLKGGRDPNTDSSQRPRPRGARLPSTSLQDTEMPSRPNPKASTPTPSQLRYLLQKSPPSVENSISSLSFTTLKRSSRIRRRDRPQGTKRTSLPPIVTDFSRMSSGSLQSTPPLSGRMDSPPTHSPTPSIPSLKETPTPRDSPVDLQHSPCSIYSVNSVRHTSLYVEWDSTGYLAPVQSRESTLDNLASCTDVHDRSEDGAPLKRQDTKVITELLRQRRHRAGTE